MKAASSLVVGLGALEAAERAAGEVLEELGGGADLVIVFAGNSYWEEAGSLLGRLRATLGSVPLIGCVAQGVIGQGREVEEGPAVSLWVANGFPEPVETFAVEYLATASGGLFAGHRFEAGGGPYLVFSDPFSLPLEELLLHLNTNVPGALVAGGVASGGIERRRSALFLDGEVLHEGAVGAHLPGAKADLLVSQGCRPIGNPYTVTRAEGTMVAEIGGRPAYERLERLVAGVRQDERALLADGGLLLGVAMDEYRDRQGRGDFLARRVLGVDPETGAVVVAGEVEVGQTVQFLARDAASAGQDLEDALERELAALAGREPAGVLLFTCNGRGSRLFPAPDHDAGLVAKVLGPVPTAGFFAAGELGPVGAKNFLHAFSASLAVFR
jgi:small ligand-binding sensory domain FIST